MAAPAKCQECGARPKARPQHRCRTCLDRRLPIGEQVEAAERRRTMVPDALAPTAVPKELWPPGQRWCGGCRSFVDLKSTGANARCHPCRSRAYHAAYIQKTYGIDLAEYTRLLTLQAGRCAICRNRPQSERLAVDHDHQNGKVRGLLCARCNHELLGAAHDSVAILKNAVAYLECSPASGLWSAPLPTPAQARKLSILELSHLWAWLERQDLDDPAPF